MKTKVDIIVLALLISTTLALQSQVSNMLLNPLPVNRVRALQRRLQEVKSELKEIKSQLSVNEYYRFLQNGFSSANKQAQNSSEANSTTNSSENNSAAGSENKNSSVSNSELNASPANGESSNNSSEQAANSTNGEQANNTAATGDSNCTHNDDSNVTNKTDESTISANTTADLTNNHKSSPDESHDTELVSDTSSLPTVASNKDEGDASTKLITVVTTPPGAVINHIHTYDEVPVMVQSNENKDSTKFLQ